MAETLIVNGDGDDYFKLGVSIAEAYANGYGGDDRAPARSLETCHSPLNEAALYAGQVTLHCAIRPSFN